MSKIINLFKNKEEYETCVICKCTTNVKREEPIGERYGYIEGAGQLCYDCYKKLYGANEK